MEIDKIMRKFCRHAKCYDDDDAVLNQPLKFILRSSIELSTGRVTFTTFKRLSGMNDKPKIASLLYDSNLDIDKVMNH